MGGAILKGYLASGMVSSEDIYVVDSDKDKLKLLAKELQIHGCSSVEEITGLCDVILLGVKPNGFEEVLPQVHAAYGEEKIIVSMAAGISMGFMEAFLGDKAKIIRIMPNTPAMVKEAMIAVCRNQNVTDEEFSKVLEIFQAIGKAPASIDRRALERDCRKSVFAVSGVIEAVFVILLRVFRGLR